MTEQNGIVWNICTCSTGSEVVVAERMKDRYDTPSCVPLMPRYHVPRNLNKVVEGGWTEVPAIPGIVFCQLPANINYQRFMSACSVRRIMTLAGKLSTVSDARLNSFIESVASGLYSSKLTRAAVFFAGLLGKSYTIPRGIFTGHRVKLIAISGSFVEFEIDIAGAKTIQKGPLTLLAKFGDVPPDFIDLAEGVRLRLTPDEEVAPERLGPVDGSIVETPSVRFASNGGAPIYS